jgi:hypothetical protein
LDPNFENRGDDHLKEILRSESFRRSSTLRCLLDYLWKNRLQEISEYAIAVDALGRRPSFDSKVDATVRVQISRLRQALARYYDSEGQLATERFVIPKGSHQIELAPGHVDHEEDDATSSVRDQQIVDSNCPRIEHYYKIRRSFFLLLLCGLVLLFPCMGGLAWLYLHRDRQSAAAASRNLPSFWHSFLGNGRPIHIILPTPMFLNWTSHDGNSGIMARDVSVNSYNQIHTSKAIETLEDRLGKPQRWSHYTVASDTFASLRLVRFFLNYQLHSFVSGTAKSPQEITGGENLIVLGTSTSIAPRFRHYIDHLRFQLGPYPFENYVIDKTSSRRIRHEFPSMGGADSRAIYPGIIALEPQASGGGRILFIEGLQTSALTSFLTSHEGMKQIARAQALHGHNPYFEAVVLSDVNAGTPIISRMVAFQPLTRTQSLAKQSDAGRGNFDHNYLIIANSSR